MSTQVAPKTTRSGRAIKDSDKKKRMQETEAMADRITPPKHKRNGGNKENQVANKGKKPEFQINPLTENSTSLRGNPVNLQARKAGLPIPRSTATPVLKPAKITAGQRRTDSTPAPSSRKLTAEKAAELAAIRNPFGVAPTGQHVRRQSLGPPSRRVSKPSTNSAAVAGPSRSRQAELHLPSSSGNTGVRTSSTRSQSASLSKAKQDDHRVYEHKTDRAQASDDGSDAEGDALFLAHYRVSQIRTQAVDDVDSPEDREAGIPREWWIPSRLRDRAKNARILLGPDSLDGEDEDPNQFTEDGAFEEEGDGSSHAHHREDHYEESEHGDENHDMADIFRDDEHNGEFDDAPDVEDEEYDSDAPLAKRRRVSSRPDSDPRSEYPKASRIRDHVEGKRPRIADYEPDAQHILVQAIRIFKSLVSTENAYPDKLTELTWAKQAWWEAADELDIELAPNRECTKIITAYSWHLRGEMKTAARTLVETVYRFRASGQTALQLRNRERAAALRKDDAFVYYKRGKTVDDHEGLYQADVIQQMANRLYFKNKKDDGIALKDKYSPFPIVAFALILAAVECAIEEWSDGSFTKVPFTEEKYAPIYRHHLRELRQFEAASDDLEVVTQICRWIYEDGRIYAKAGPDETLVTRSLGAKVHAKALADFKRTGGRYDRASADDDEN